MIRVWPVEGSVWALGFLRFRSVRPWVHVVFSGIIAPPTRIPIQDCSQFFIGIKVPTIVPIKDC